MSRSTKLNLAKLVTVLGIIAECIGLYNMMATRSPAGLKGIGLMIIGFTLGVPALLVWKYMSSMPSSVDREKIAVETLAKLAENNQNKLNPKR